jgi:hypothetical protein
MSYCAAGAAAFHRWSKLTLTGLVPGAYATAVVSLQDANGNPIPGFQNVVLPSGATTLDVSSIPVGAPTATITAMVTLTGVTSASGITSGRVALAWLGDPVQVCFATVVGAARCSVDQSITNRGRR